MASKWSSLRSKYVTSIRSRVNMRPYVEDWDHVNCKESKWRIASRMRTIFLLSKCMRAYLKSDVIENHSRNFRWSLSIISTCYRLSSYVFIIRLSLISGVEISTFDFVICFVMLMRNKLFSFVSPWCCNLDDFSIVYSPR